MEKLSNLEQNIKNLLIPYLIFYLNYPQLEVNATIVRSRNSLGRRLRRSR